jgi:murein DD-endopeptidase MepM/ murein hydrolase activator NlpD
MCRLGRGMRPGVHVHQGQVIGYVGSTGLATGPHVCFRYWQNGTQVNPARMRTPEANPLPKVELQDFFARRDSVLTELNAHAGATTSKGTPLSVR